MRLADELLELHPRLLLRSRIACLDQRVRAILRGQHLLGLELLLGGQSDELIASLLRLQAADRDLGLIHQARQLVGVGLDILHDLSLNYSRVPERIHGMEPALAGILRKLLFNATPTPSESEIALQVAHAVKFFLKVYKPAKRQAHATR